MKKLLCLFLLCLVASTAHADTYVSGDYKYIRPHYVDYKVVITRYTGDATEVVIPDELDGRPVAYLGPEIFYENDALTSVTIPTGVTVDYFGNPFQHCSSLTTINIAPEDPVLKIVDGALINKTEKRLICYPLGLGITSCDVPEGIEMVGSGAFANCTTLTSITLPDSVREIGTGAFENCTGLTFVTLPDSVKEIGFGAFDGCSNLCSINIPDGVTVINSYSFSDCTDLSSISIPNGVTEIGDRAFYRCTKLDEVFIPASVKSIGEHAFDYYFGGSRLSLGMAGYYPCCTLVVVRNSYAERYASSNGIPFTYADQEALTHADQESQQQVGTTACPYCHGGWRDCTVCDTAGQCTYCFGSGYKSIYTSKGYEYRTCGLCRGTGACSMCGYSGFFQCSACGGTGIID